MYISCNLFTLLCPANSGYKNPRIIQEPSQASVTSNPLSRVKAIEQKLL